MNTVNTEDVKKLVKYSLAFAVLMKDEELDSVVSTFMDVRAHRKKIGGGQDC